MKKIRAILVILMTALLPGALHAATVQFNQVSSPAGIVSQSNTLESGTSATTISAPLSSNGYQFVYWDLNGVRQNDSAGRALVTVQFAIYENTTATAHYLLATDDTDADGIPDWFEILNYGTLAYGPNDDTDGDGLTLLQEYQRDLNPTLKNETREGGVSRAESATVYAVLSPGYFHYIESSSPAGFLSRHLIVASGSTVLSSRLSGENSGYTFGYFDVDGVRQQDPSGRALSQFTVPVTHDTNVVAHYFPTSDDTDGDGIPDWYEWLYFGTLSYGPNDDTDGDGLTLLQEYQRDLNPDIKNQSVDGGISRASSDSVVYSMAGFYRYTITSNPTGFVTANTGAAQAGTVIATPNLHGDSNGYSFAYWTVNGVRQADSSGIALGQVNFALSTDTVATAVWLPTSQDSDNDGIPDWYELQYSSNLSQSGTSDPDGNGLTLAQEYAMGLVPNVSFRALDGGVSRASSALATMNMQPFERLRYAKLGNLLTEFFSYDPNLLPLTGYNFGSNVSVALCDWDGDGDLDLFVASSNGLRVFENTGTKANMLLEERTAQFAGLSAYLLSRPSAVLSAGDWNLDGKEDLVIGDGAGNVLLVASSGNFGSSQPTGPTQTVVIGGSKAIPAVGDLNGDNKPDLLVVGDDDTAQVIYHNGGTTNPYSGAKVANICSAPIPNATGAAIADITGDGVNDVLVADGDGRIWEFHGASSGGVYILNSKVWAGSGSGYARGLTIAVRDLDGDGDMDVVGGCANGALVALRDPHVGRPTGLVALPGASSILLQWDPDSQSRIAGYNIYRTLTGTSQWAQLNALPDPLPQYLDSAVMAQTTYDYCVTGLTRVMYPGNSVPQIIEGLPSGVVTATPGSVTVSSKSVHGKAGKTVTVKLSVANSVGLSAAGMDLRVAYNPSQLKPASQVDSSLPTVETSGLSKDVVLTDNGLTATGTLRIQGISGVMKSGNGVMFGLDFVVGSGIPAGTVLSVTVTSAVFKDAFGNTLATTIDNSGTITVDTAYLPGDLTGDGLVNSDDETLLKELIKPKARAATPAELAAGDLNGDGKLDQKDLTLLKQLLQGVTP